MMLSGGKEVLHPNAAGWIEKQQINLEVDILSTSGTVKQCTSLE